MKKGIALSIDYTGAHGGQLAAAFGAGCVAASAFWGALGKLMYKIIGKSKDDTIADLKRTIEGERARCTDMETRLVQRIQQLEGFILAISPGHLRQDIQRAISEQRVTGDEQ